MVPSELLRELRGLDKTSPRFHKQLADILHGDEYRNAIPNLEDEDVAWLVQYLDDVSHRTVFFSLFSDHKYRSLPMLSTLHAPNSRRPYMS